ncbi:hypothetical protein Tco_1308397 [Tanacetum coccineum]
MANLSPPVLHNHIDEEEFEEEDPQEDPEDKEEIKADEEMDGPEWMLPYDGAEPLNPPPPVSGSESEDEVVPTHGPAFQRPPHIRRFVSIVYVGGASSSQPSSGVEQRVASLEDRLKKMGDAEDRVESRKPKRELEEAKLSNMFIRWDKERVEKDLYEARVQAHRFFRELVRRGVAFEERLSEAIDV